MKATIKFKETIQARLVEEGNADANIQNALNKSGKSIDDCIQYILNTVKNSGFNGFEDSEVYAMALEYYVNDNINIGTPIQSHVVINRIPELTKDEQEEAKTTALDKLIHEETKRLTKKSIARTKSTEVSPSLFD